MRPQIASRAAWLALTGSLLAASTALAGPEGPPYFDAGRNITEQADAARDAKRAVQAGEFDANQVLQWFVDPSGQVRDEVFKALVARNDPDLLAQIEGGLRHRDPFVAAGVAELYGECGYEAGREALERHGLGSREEMVALESVWALEALGSADSGDALERAHSRSRSWRVKGDALIALATCDPDRAGPLAVEALEDRDPPVRIAALEALRRLDQHQAAEAAVAFIEDDGLGRSAAGWKNRLLFCSLDVLAGWCDRSADPELARRAVDALIERLDELEEGLPKHRVGLALGDLTNEGGMGADAEVWSGWWDARRDSFVPADKDPEDVVWRGSDTPSRPETGGGMTTRVRFHGIPVYSNRLIFSQDVSGGMNNPLNSDDDDSPTKMDFSKNELINVLEALKDREDCGVNVVFFATDFYKPADQLLPLRRAHGQLTQFIRNQQTPSGRAMARSNLYDVLEFAISDPEIDTVFFLSEGGPNEGRFVDRTRLLRHLDRTNVYARVIVHCLQVSTSRSGATFLRHVAETLQGRFYDLEYLQQQH
jgi:HEAT repeat protein